MWGRASCLLVVVAACSGGDDADDLGPYTHEATIDVRCETTLPAETFTPFAGDPELIWAGAGLGEEPNHFQSYLTRDGGQSWRGYGFLFGVAQLDATTAVMYGDPNDRSLARGLYRMTFDGDDVAWSPLTPPYAEFLVRRLVGSGDGRAYGIDDLNQGFVVDDGGDTWTLVDVEGVGQLAASGDHVAMWSDTTIHVSDDGGATFTARQLPSAGAPAVAISGSGELVVVDASAAWTSQDGGASWRSITPVLEAPLTGDLGMWPTFAGERLWLSLDFDLSRHYDGVVGGLLMWSDDHGETWTRRHPVSGPLTGDGVMVQDMPASNLRFAPGVLAGLPDGEVMMTVHATDTDQARGGGLCVTGAGNAYAFPDFLPDEVPAGRMIAYDHFGPIDGTVQMVVDYDGKAHFLDQGQLFSGPKADHVAWWVPTLGAPTGVPPDSLTTSIGFELLATNELALGAMPASLSAVSGPSPGVAIMDPSTRSFVEFIELGKLVHGTEQIYVPFTAMHVRRSGEIWVDVAGPAPNANNWSYPIPFYDNAAPSAPGGYYSPFTNDAFFQWPEAGIASIVRVGAGDPPTSVPCDVDTPPSTRCFHYTGSIRAAAVSEDDVFYVVEQSTGDVLGHDLEDLTDTWTTVATGFVAPSVVFAARDGSGALFVMDGDVYAFIPDPGQIFARQD